MATHGEIRWPSVGTFDGRLRGDSHGRRHVNAFSCPDKRSESRRTAAATRLVIVRSDSVGGADGTFRTSALLADRQSRGDPSRWAQLLLRLARRAFRRRDVVHCLLSSRGVSDGGAVGRQVDLALPQRTPVGMVIVMLRRLSAAVFPTRCAQAWGERIHSGTPAGTSNSGISTRSFGLKSGP